MKRQTLSPSAAGYDVPGHPVSSDWKPTQVQVRCASASCPEAVGVLLFAAPVDPQTKTAMVYRCTAFLVEANAVLSNGHCDFSDRYDGYFVALGRNGRTEIRSIARVDGKVFTANAEKPDDISGRPDLARYLLSQPIDDLTPLTLDLKGGLPFGSLTAYMANADGESENYVIERETCTLHYHGIYFPYRDGENPDVLRAFDCPGVRGNSGSPLLSGGGAVEAVLMGVASQDTILKSLDRAPYSYEVHDQIAATNVRCVDFLTVHRDSPCIVADQKENGRRFTAMIDELNREIQTRRPPGDAGADTEFEAHRYLIGGVQAGLNQDFDVVYWPKCTRQATRLTRLEFPEEHCHVDFGAWAEPRIETLGQQVSEATVLAPPAQSAYRIQVQWAQPFAQFAQAENDPRVRFGSRSFSIALPQCGD